jgi:hypothetical protein
MFQRSAYEHKRGELKIPHGAKIYRSEPAIEMRTKPNTVIYHSTPFNELEKFDPLKKLTVYEELKESASGLVRPFVECWQYQDEIKSSKSPPLQLDHLRQIYIKRAPGDYLMGCVKTQDLFEPDDKQTTVFKKLKEHDDIFPTQPSKVQIRQRFIGNCFVLAPVLSILAQKKGYEFFLNCMRQLDDGTTIVRLFDPSLRDPDRNSVYVQVSNSTMVRDGRETIYHDAPWVHILEKAYVAFFGLQRFSYRKKSIHLFPNFESEQNLTSYAIQILTGHRTESIRLPNPFREKMKSSQEQKQSADHYQVKVEQTFQLTTPRAAMPDKKKGEKEEDRIFKLLQTKLKEQCLVVATSLPKLPQIKEAAGLVPEHSYPVIKVFISHNPEKSGEMMIRLRNPWGRVGQLTNSKGEKKEDQDIPEFYMDFRDFMTIFSDCVFGSLPKPPSPALENPHTPR